jgi:hypothetical protein
MRRPTGRTIGSVHSGRSTHNLNDASGKWATSSCWRRRGEKLNTLETEGQMIQRVIPDLMGLKNFLVINDEAHHCYREKPDDENEKLIGDDREEAEKKTKPPATGSNGLEAVKRQLSLTKVMDLSATPFFLRGSGYHVNVGRASGPMPLSFGALQTEKLRALAHKINNLKKMALGFQPAFADLSNPINFRIGRHLPGEPRLSDRRRNQRPRRHGNPVHSSPDFRRSERPGKR